MTEKVRLQKYMSAAGICSRRKAEEFIEAGFVEVNGQVAHVGQSVIPGIDTVQMKDQIIEEQKKFVYYKFHKPRGIETTCAQKGGKSIVDIIETPERVFPVGRLDKESTGLILLTNDGRIANYLMHPRYKHEKEYLVETFWPISDEALETMSEWVHILWRYTNKAKITRTASGKFSIVLTEWRNRQIRRMVEAVWWKVKKLKRIRIENVELSTLKEGSIKYLWKGELQQLFKKMNIQETL